MIQVDDKATLHLTQVRQARVVTLIITNNYGFHLLIFGTTSLSFNR